MSDVSEPTEDAIRECSLQVIGFLTAIETEAGEADAELLSGSPTESELDALLSALLRMCQSFAFDLARCEGLQLIDVYAREAARVIDES